MFVRHKLAAALLGSAALVAACTTPTSSRQDTAQTLSTILAGDQRSEADRARDPYRHPKETLLFFGVRPQLTVLEVWPEPGWYTEILAPLLKYQGRYYAALTPDPKSKHVSQEQADFRAKLAARPELYSKAQLVDFPLDGSDAVPPGSVDMVVTFRNVHNWMADKAAPQAFATMYRALKPGGVLGVVEHRGNPAVPQDPQAKSGYVNEDYAIKLIEAQGFRLVGSSQVNANPRDTKDYEQGVWTLPPTYRLGAKDHDKYAAIGESDRFTLKFQKPKR
jgi:predicted methyltransferase